MPVDRLSAVSSVMKSILDKVERDEKAEQRRQRKQETNEDKMKRAQALKLQATLTKHKDQLKKEMLKKRNIMEKALAAEIQVDCCKSLLFNMIGNLCFNAYFHSLCMRKDFK